MLARYTLTENVDILLWEMHRQQSLIRSAADSIYPDDLFSVDCNGFHVSFRIQEGFVEYGIPVGMVRGFPVK